MGRVKNKERVKEKRNGNQGRQCQEMCNERKKDHESFWTELNKET